LVAAQPIRLEDSNRLPGSTEDVIIKASPVTNEDMVAVVRLSFTNAQIIEVEPLQALTFGACEGGSLFTSNSICADIATSEYFHQGDPLLKATIKWGNEGESLITAEAENGYYDGFNLNSNMLNMAVDINGILPLTGEDTKQPLENDQSLSVFLIIAGGFLVVLVILILVTRTHPIFNRIPVYYSIAAILLLSGVAVFIGNNIKSNEQSPVSSLAAPPSYTPCPPAYQKSCYVPGDTTWDNQSCDGNMVYKCKIDGTTDCSLCANCDFELTYTFWSVTCSDPATSSDLCVKYGVINGDNHCAPGNRVQYSCDKYTEKAGSKRTCNADEVCQEGLGCIDSNPEEEGPNTVTFTNSSFCTLDDSLGDWSSFTKLSNSPYLEVTLINLRNPFYDFVEHDGRSLWFVVANKYVDEEQWVPSDLDSVFRSDPEVYDHHYWNLGIVNPTTSYYHKDFKFKFWWFGDVEAMDINLYLVRATEEEISNTSNHFADLTKQSCGKISITKTAEVTPTDEQPEPTEEQPTPTQEVDRCAQIETNGDWGGRGYYCSPGASEQKLLIYCNTDKTEDETKQVTCDGNCVKEAVGENDHCPTAPTGTTGPTVNPTTTVYPTNTTQPTPTATPGIYQCGQKGCTNDNQCEIGLPDYECDETEDESRWPQDNVCVRICPAGTTQTGPCSCSSDAETVTCGPLDVNGDKILNYIDLGPFSRVYNKTCSDSPYQGGTCGGKDHNGDGKINYTDLGFFSSNYYPKQLQCN
jgi:hypothetical protein